jgi:hypothetical protein
MKIINYSSILIMFLSISSCLIEENETITNASLDFSFSHSQICLPDTSTDNKLLLDKLIYSLSPDGSIIPELYSVKNLNYLISNISLTSSDGSNFPLEDIYFVNVLNQTSLTLNLGEIPNNIYTHFNFQFGLDNSINLSNNFVNESFHTTMAWPEMMGGGYHYMKLEGAYQNDSTFYNTHTGPSMGVDYSFMVSKEIALNVDGDLGDISFDLNMIIDNWYKNPNDISFANAIMMDMQKQMQFKMNGMTDVFTIELNK